MAANIIASAHNIGCSATMHECAPPRSARSAVCKRCTSVLRRVPRCVAVIQTMHEYAPPPRSDVLRYALICSAALRALRKDGANDERVSSEALRHAPRCVAMMQTMHECAPPLRATRAPLSSLLLRAHRLGTLIVLS